MVSAVQPQGTCICLPHHHHHAPHHHHHHAPHHHHHAHHHHDNDDAAHHDHQQEAVSKCQGGCEAGVVCLLFLVPVSPRLRPCPYHLDGVCLYEQRCRFSHGELRRVRDLREYTPRDISSLSVSSPCLARYTDHVWYPAIITAIEEGVYSVRYDCDSLGEGHVTAADITTPPKDHSTTSTTSSTSSSTSSSSAESDDDDGDGERLLRVPVDSTSLSPPALPLAVWETHTRGVASRLMAKMGYVPGTGLGLRGDGRLEPVLVSVLPSRRSLDYCRHGNDGGDKAPGNGRGRCRGNNGARGNRGGGGSGRGNGGGGGGGGQGGAGDVFDFLNQALNPTHRSSPSPGERTVRTVGVELVRIGEEAGRAEREVAQLTRQMQRHAGEKVTNSHLEARLSVARSRLAELRSREASLIQQRRSQRDLHKMIAF
uniref:Zinc finger CCCH-type with G patch domain-containing protein n=1 Tax=Petromyzon marinus TaxID=7757 RepID=A0AAJ7SKZ7_PETMA|nr:zinc finger CCCH-type with G patch domain-containing protein [Petromyzon marinus]